MQRGRARRFLFARGVSSDARLALRLDDNWEISAWGKNLTDETYVTETFDQEVISNMLFMYNMPLTWGVTASYSF